MRVRGERGPLDRPDPLRLRGFVPLDELEAAPPQGRDAGSVDEPSPLPSGVLADGPDWASRTSLFGEPEG